MIQTIQNIHLVGQSSYLAVCPEFDPVLHLHLYIIKVKRGEDIKVGNLLI